MARNNSSRKGPAGPGTDGTHDTGVAVMEPPAGGTERFAQDAPRPPASVRSIPIAEISTEVPNHRHAHRHDKQALEQLAASMKEGGLRQPIKVVLDGAFRGKSSLPYLLVYGHRRLAAARLLGWTHIDAQVADSMTIDQLMADRAIENLHRLDLNIVEQVSFVEQLVRSMTRQDGEGPVITSPHLVERVGAQVGQPVEWVRDRLYLGARLSPKVKQMALEDRLLLGHLRELAKLGDYREQERIAVDGAREADGSGHLQTVEWFRTEVLRRQRMLDRVAWKLELPFAGKPACTGCPHNTATDPVLFEGVHDAKAKGGTCLNGPCFDAKSSQVERAKAETVAKLKKRKLEPTAENVRDAVPDYLRPEPAQRLARKELGEPKKGAEAKKFQPSSGGYVDASKTPLGKYDKALDDWRDGLVEQVEEAARSRPIVFASLRLLGDVEGMRGVDYNVPIYNRETKPAKQPNLTAAHIDRIDAALEGTTGGLEKLIEHVKSDKWNGPLEHLINYTPAAVKRIAEGLGVTVPPEPLWSDFEATPEPKPKADKKGPSKKTKKKAGAAR